MGECFSKFMSCCCGEEAGPQSNEVNERTHLLVDPVSSSTNIPRAHSDDYINQYSSSVPKKSDEQNALSRILLETANNIIDIGALDSHNLEQHEYMERSRAYAKRIETGNFKIPKRNACLLQDIPAPEKVLSGAPISYMDEQLIFNFVNTAASALEAVKVEHKEDLVVPFLS